MKTSDPLPRYLYHTLYYVTHQTEQSDAIEEFVNKLLDDGYDIDFVHSMQLTVFPKSGISNYIAISAQYWN